MQKLIIDDTHIGQCNDQNCFRNKYFPALLWEDLAWRDGSAWRQRILWMSHFQPAQSDGGINHPKYSTWKFFIKRIFNNQTVNIIRLSWKYQVSWIRRSDGYPLYIGDERFINDKRFELISTRLASDRFLQVYNSWLDKSECYKSTMVGWWDYYWVNNCKGFINWLEV